MGPYMINTLTNTNMQLYMYDVICTKMYKIADMPNPSTDFHGSNANMIIFLEEKYVLMVVNVSKTFRLL